MEQRALLNTSKGLNLIRTANVLAIISTCVAMISAIIVLGGTAAFLGGAANGESFSPAAGIVAIIGGLGSIVGLILVLTGVIMELVGLAKTSNAHSGYKTGLILVLVSIIVSIVANLLPLPDMLSNIIDAISPILGALVVFFVISATADILKSKGDPALAESGVKTRNIYIICAIIGVLTELAVLIPAFASFILVFTAIAAIIQLVALFKYIKFLGASVKVLNS